MRYRYTTGPDGKPVRTAVIYTAAEHGIALEDIDPDAVFVCRKLRAAGHEAYIVGGALRDLLLGKRPKDFDVATSAHPRQVKKVLPRSRIIGKRFRLVHVLFHTDKVIEVATFRSDKTEDTNTFGTLEEDVHRRDFTCNALYYDPREGTLIDHVGGLQDIRRRVLKPVLPLKTMFVEDPVRMLRAVKYAVMGRLKMGFFLRWKIRSEAFRLGTISPSRLTEEFFKILKSGRSWDLLQALQRFQLLHPFLPELAKNFSRLKPSLARCLQILDKAVQESEQPLTRPEALYFLLEGIMEGMGHRPLASAARFSEHIDWAKQFIRPVVPANKEFDFALRALYKHWGVKVPRPNQPRLAQTAAAKSSTPTTTKRRRRRRRRKSQSTPTPEA